MSNDGKSKAKPPPLSPTFWIGKRSAYRLWQSIHTFVQDYTAENQDQLQAPWFNTWYNYFEVIKIGDENRDFQMTAYIITSNPDASVYDCFETICNLIPNLRSYYMVQEKSSTGSLRCKIQRYGFTTPKTSIKTPPRKQKPPLLDSKPNQTNRYAILNEEEQDVPSNLNVETTFTDDHDALLLSELNIPTKDNSVQANMSSDLSDNSRLQMQNLASVMSNEQPSRQNNIKQEDTETSVINEDTSAEPNDGSASKRIKGITDFFQKDKPTLSSIKNKTTNALRLTAFKVKDFATDSELSTMLRNKTFSTKSRHDNDESFPFDTEIDVNDVAYLKVIGSII